MSKSRELVEEGISTIIHDQPIMTTPSIINTILGYIIPLTDPHTLTPVEDFQRLRPNDLVRPLNFKPINMPDSHGALFYIYTRTIINKSKNFTHFSQRDYYFNAPI